MEIKEGMYCYEKNNRKSGIGKIISFQRNNNVNVKYKNNVNLVSVGNIKGSYDITNLIEVGDVIAIKEDIDKFSQVFILGIYEQELLKEIKSKIESGKLILDRVLTKEQFEREAYKL